MRERERGEIERGREREGGREKGGEGGSHDVPSGCCVPSPSLWSTAVLWTTYSL